MAQTSIDQFESIKNFELDSDEEPIKKNLSTDLTQKSLQNAGSAQLTHKIKVIFLREQIQELEQKILMLRSDLNPNWHREQDLNVTPEKWRKNFESFLEQIKILQKNYVHYNVILKERRFDVLNEIDVG